MTHLSSAPQHRRSLTGRLVDITLPLFVLGGLLLTWEAVVRLNAIPVFILPPPSLIAATLRDDWPLLRDALVVTLRITAQALGLAVIFGVGLALLFVRWGWLARSFFPLAVIIQVTPILAVAPLLLVYLEPDVTVLVCAFLVAFFPILANSVQGLRSTDPQLQDLFTLYGASGWQRIWLLRVPTALPFFLGGLRIAGGLALVGAVVAEIAAGSAGKGSGLAFRIVESGYRLNIPRMFAALALISASGIAIFALCSLIEKIALRHRQTG
jgi:NitT/TauT family transport system permease protein